MAKGPSKRKCFSVTGNTKTRLLNGVPNKQIKVKTFLLLVSAETNVTFTEETSNTAVIMDAGRLPVGVSSASCDEGWTLLALGKGLDIQLSASVTITGTLVYELV